jgi:hypothetical protein
VRSVTRSRGALGVVIVLAVVGLAVAVWWAADGRPAAPRRAGDRPPGDRVAPPGARTPETHPVGPPPEAGPSLAPPPAPATGSPEPSRAGSPPTAWLVEETIRRTFAAFNAQDLDGLLPAWTPRGFEQAFGLPLAAAARLDNDVFTMSGPYAIDGFSGTEVGPRGATTLVDMTNGQRKERHRMALVVSNGAWKIDRDEQVALPVPRNGLTVDVKITARSLQVGSPAVVGDRVAFRVANADEKRHELIVMRRDVASGAQESLGRVGPLRPGEQAALLLTDLRPGPYVLLCNMLDGDGKPYSSKGLRAEFSIR